MRSSLAMRLAIAAACVVGWTAGPASAQPPGGVIDIQLEELIPNFDPTKGPIQIQMRDGRLQVLQNGQPLKNPFGTEPSDEQPPEADIDGPPAEGAAASEGMAASERWTPLVAVERQQAGTPIVVGTRAMHLWKDLSTPRGDRFVVVELSISRPAVDGPTGDSPSVAPAIELPLDQITLTADGTAYPVPEKLKSSLRRNSFEWFGRRVRVDAYAQPQPRSLRPGEQVDVLLVFQGLPVVSHVPTLELAWPGLARPVDLRQLATDRMKLSTQTVGPKQAVGVVTVRGPVGAIAVGPLVETINRIEANGTRRVVLELAKDSAASPSDDEAEADDGSGQGGLATDMLQNWLVMVAQDRTQTRTAYMGLPSVSTGLLQLQLLDSTGDWTGQIAAAGVPLGEDESVIHTDRGAAIRAALSDALESWRRDPLLQLVRTSGDESVRAAALEAAIGKLAPSDEPLLRALLTNPGTSPALRNAAVEALGQMPSESATATLLQLAGRERHIDRDETSNAARALRTLLQRPPSELAGVLDRLDPRQLHTLTAMEPLLEQADPDSPAAAALERTFRAILAGPERTVDDLEPPDGTVYDPRKAEAALKAGRLDRLRTLRWPGLGTRALRASALWGLSQLKVDDLSQLVYEARTDSAGAMRTTALAILRDSADPGLKAQLVDELLTELQGGRITAETFQLLEAVSDPRVVPPLAERFPSLEPDLAAASLDVLGRLGSQSQLADLAGHYDDLPAQTRAELLKQLAMRRLPVALEIARRELTGPDRTRHSVQNAATALMQFDTAEAIALLLEALDAETEQASRVAIVRTLRPSMTTEVYERFGRLFLNPETSSPLRRTLAEERQRFERAMPGYQQIRMALAEPRDAVPDDKALPPELLAERRQQARIKQARRQAQKLTIAIKLAPDLPAAYHHRGFAYLTMGQPRFAVDDFTKSIEQGSIDRESWAMLAIAQMGLGRVRDGLATIEQARTIPMVPTGATDIETSDDAIFLYNLGCAYACGRAALLADPPPPAVQDLDPRDRTRLLRELTDRAFDMLAEAGTLVQADPDGRGQSLFREYLEEDPDLRSLQGEPRWEPTLQLYDVGGDDAE